MWDAINDISGLLGRVLILLALFSTDKRNKHSGNADERLDRRSDPTETEIETEKTWTDRNRRKHVHAR